MVIIFIYSSLSILVFVPHVSRALAKPTLRSFFGFRSTFAPRADLQTSARGSRSRSTLYGEHEESTLSDAPRTRGARRAALALLALPGYQIKSVLHTDPELAARYGCRAKNGSSALTP